MKQNLVPFAWALSLGTTTLAVISWWQCIGVPFSKMTVYDIFPVFGLVAFSLMWSHYIIGAIRQYYKVDRKVLHHWFSTTAYLVLIAILMHPGLLEYQLWRDGEGILPYSYVGPKLAGAVVLGQVSLLAFLTFELHRFYREKGWWHWVERASDVAIILILIHAYQLGCSLLPGWFRYVWFFYGVTLIAAIGYSAHLRHQTTQKWL